MPIIRCRRGRESSLPCPSSLPRRAATCLIFVNVSEAFCVPRQTSCRAFVLRGRRTLNAYRPDGDAEYSSWDDWDEWDDRRDRRYDEDSGYYQSPSWADDDEWLGIEDGVAAGLPAWEQWGRCEVLAPPAEGDDALPLPLGVVHLIGGAVVGSTPKLAYDGLASLLCLKGFLVVATPLDPIGASTLWNHRALAACAAEDFAVDGMGGVAARFGGAVAARLPVFGLGHSLGAKMQLIIGSDPVLSRLANPHRPRAANVLVAYNNFGASQSVPLLREAKRAAAEAQRTLDQLRDRQRGRRQQDDRPQEEQERRVRRQRERPQGGGGGEGGGSFRGEEGYGGVNGGREEEGRGDGGGGGGGRGAPSRRQAPPSRGDDWVWAAAAAEEDAEAGWEEGGDDGGYDRRTAGAGGPGYDLGEVDGAFDDEVDAWFDSWQDKAKKRRANANARRESGGGAEEGWVDEEGWEGGGAAAAEAYDWLGEGGSEAYRGAKYGPRAAAMAVGPLLNGVGQVLEGAAGGAVSAARRSELGPLRDSAAWFDSAWGGREGNGPRSGGGGDGVVGRVVGGVVGGVASALRGIEFAPAPRELEAMVRDRYTVKANLLVQFDRDSLDQSPRLASLLEEKLGPFFVDEEEKGRGVTGGTAAGAAAAEAMGEGGAPRHETSKSGGGGGLRQFLRLPGNHGTPNDLNPGDTLESDRGMGGPSNDRPNHQQPDDWPRRRRSGPRGRQWDDDDGGGYGLGFEMEEEEEEEEGGGGGAEALWAAVQTSAEIRLLAGEVASYLTDRALWRRGDDDYHTGGGGGDGSGDRRRGSSPQADNGLGGGAPPSSSFSSENGNVGGQTDV